MIIFGTFVLLVSLTAWHSWSAIGQKDLNEWILDSAGLWVQGLLIPLLQLSLLQKLYQQLFPAWHHSLPCHPMLAFAISFVAVDYLYYWNHRFLHSRWGWFVHQVHHTVTTMDVLGTSRNTLWSSFLIVYLWVHGLFIYLLADPTAYVLGVSLTAALDLWRHSQFSPLPESQLHRWLSGWLILPQDHGWHHKRDTDTCNYGANLKIWDCLHGTLQQSTQWPTALGQTSGLSLWRQLIYPLKPEASTRPARSDA
ncbi:MAG: sterol desaturase family protein [Leptolyngbya sp. SIO3F4]|nr:sterol desaturase family protein [Leptolyngbya sp. SIO3F4]